MLIPQLLALPKLGKYVDLVHRQLEVTLNNVVFLPLKVPIEFRELQIMNSLINSALHIIMYIIICTVNAVLKVIPLIIFSITMRGVIETKCGG